MESGTPYEEADDAETQVVTIRWAKYSSHCLDFSHQDDVGLAGMALQIWACPEERRRRDRFIIGTGGHASTIRPANFPSLCLHEVAGLRVGFSSCSRLSEAERSFVIRRGGDSGYHHIHLSADPARCLDVPNDNHTDGNRLMLWRCPEGVAPGKYVERSPDAPGVTAQDRRGDEVFLIEELPVDCLWAGWSSWSSCSEICGNGHRTRYRAIGRSPAHGGRSCGGDWSEVQPCSAPCPAVVAEPQPWWYALPALLLLCALVPVLLYVLRKICCRRRAKPDPDPEMLGLLEETEADRQRRDQQAWLRVELQRRAREDSLRKAAEERERRRQQSAAQTEDVRCLAGHELRPPKRPERKWICNGRNAVGGCRSGITAFGFHQVERYRCEDCDFDMCGRCYEVALGPAAGRAEAPGRMRRWAPDAGGACGGDAPVSRWAPDAGSACRGDSPVSPAQTAASAPLLL